MVARSTHDPDRADLIFTGGRVHTVDPRNQIAEALAVRGDRILFAGGNAEVRASAAPGARRIDLRGRSLLPGFIDAHCHYLWLGSAQSEIDCKAPDIDSIDALVEAVRQRAAALPPGTWIRGRGYDQRRLSERRHPNRFDLDRVSPLHPVIITRTCAHICAVNSRAMELAGVTDTTPDPPAGRFDRDAGRLLGVAYEEAQAPFQRAAVLQDEEIRAALLAANRVYLAAGATSVHDAGGLLGPAFGIAQALFALQLLQVRIYAFALVGLGCQGALSLLETGIRTGFGDEHLRIGAFKIITDGSSSGPTAATRVPYCSDGEDSGILYWSQAELDRQIARAHRAGFQVTMHALGDRAIEQGLHAIERALAGSSRPDPRPRLEHCGICPPDLRARIQALGVTPAMQPAFFWEFGDGYLVNYGRERTESMFPVRSLIEAGVRVAGGSDAPVTDHRPLFGIQQALTRETASGQRCGDAERVDLIAAIRMYTIDAAYAAYEDSLKGSLEPGKLADLVVLDVNLSTVPPRQLRDVPVRMTVLGGQVVFEA